MTRPFPDHLLQNRHWKPLVFLFSEHPKLSTLFNSKYIDLEREQVRVKALRAAARGWSHAEKFMLNLALHLYNASNRLPNGLDDMDYLDSANTQLAIKAIRMRYDYWG